jgi:hypothetical protein
MTGKGRRLAIAAVTLGLAVAAATAFLLRGRILEEWHIYRFAHGDESAKKVELEWMGEYGGEVSFRCLAEWSTQNLDNPFFILSSLKTHQQTKTSTEAEWRYFVSTLLNSNPVHSSLDRAGKRIRERFGNEKLEKLLMEQLASSKASPRLLIVYARIAIVDLDNTQFPEGAFDLAVRRLRLCLSDPDPLVRTGAIYGLGDAEERAGEGIFEALTPLREDPDEVVREAAVYVIRRLSMLPSSRPEASH